MSLQRPQEVDIPDPDLLDVPPEGDQEADADREIVDDTDIGPPDELPDDANPADAYEQSLIVEYDEDDYR